MKMQTAYRKAEAAHPRENAPKAEQIRSLGLLGTEEQTADVLAKASWRMRIPGILWICFFMIACLCFLLHAMDYGTV